MINLRTCKWVCHFHKTIDRGEGVITDMYWLHLSEPGDDLISIGIPHGRDDIAQFILRSLNAGQAVLQRLPPGYQFKPDEGFKK